ncbi:MAG: peptidase [Chloroflexi bacterium]|nr:peptidase [Chloroflexota bacterium]
MTVLFMFLDGVGLGPDDPLTNPFACADLPNLQKLLDGEKLIAASAPFNGESASLLALDAALGVVGLPQSATGQAVLLTGRNIPAEIGYHYGPKPDKATAAYLLDGGIFGELTRAGKQAALVNAYPPGYFHSIDSGRRNFSSIPLAVTSAGLSLFTSDDLLAGQAISADFTAQGWRERMNMPDIPVMTLLESGEHLASLARKFDFAFFEYWLTDYAGHGQDMPAALSLLEQFDVVLGSLLDGWQETDLLLITSDHGNLEDLSTRRHTPNPVPLLLVGNKKLRRHFDGVTDLCGVAPAILKAIG